MLIHILTVKCIPGFHEYIPRQELTCGPGFPRMPGKPGAPWTPCPIQTKVKNSERQSDRIRSLIYFLAKQTFDMHDSQFKIVLSLEATLLCDGFEFCLHTETNVEGEHMNFLKLNSRHLEKSFCKDKGCVTRVYCR